MNITEFAQYAGVSKAAVSRYFNGGYLSADKRAVIEAAVEATGYHPSAQAQMLRTRRTRQIGVILPKLSSDSCPRMVEGIGSVLEESDYQLLLSVPRRHRGRTGRDGPYAGKRTQGTGLHRRDPAGQMRRTAAAGGL